MKKSKPTPLAASTSKPRRESSSRLRPASTSKQQQQQQPSSSSLVRIDTLSVAELRKYAHMVTVKNEEYKQRLKVAHEMYVMLQDAYQRLKQKKQKIPEAVEAVEEEEGVVTAPGWQPAAGNVGAKQGRKSTEETKSMPVRRSARKLQSCPPTRPAPGSQDTLRSGVTASQLTEGLLALPGNLQLATLTGEDDVSAGGEAKKENTGDVSVDDTPGTEATPREASNVRKRLMNLVTSPAWETIQKKKKHQMHEHLGYERIPVPEEPIKGLNLFGDAEPQLDEDKAFKYMKVVRKQDERAKLPAGFCADCARFYRVYAKHGNFEEANAMAQRMCGHTIHQQTSRHRQKWQAPDSPEDFWHVRPPEPHS